MTTNSLESQQAAPGLTLPLFLTRKNKYGIGFIWYIIAASLYLASNHFHFVEPRLLPMSWIDQVTPFIPQTVWIYITEYVFFIVIYMTCNDILNVNKYLYSFFALQVVSVTIFFIWPTTYPRDLFPLVPGTMDGITYYVFNALRATDSPANCCPSLHVSSVYLSTFLFLDEQREKFPFFFIWGTLIALSTLTTKQHYIVDVVTGLMMAAAVYWVFHRWVRYRGVIRA